MDLPSKSADGRFLAPLFPLPNVVLFPRAILPLHIFEERYKTMTADALAGDRLVAMALLRPGWEKDYYGRAAVEPVVCVGRILSCEKLADRKYNFLLQGEMRARIVREVHADRPYRTAELIPLEESSEIEIDLTHARQRMLTVFSHGALSQTTVGRRFAEMLGGSMLTSDVADLIAFHFFDDVALKQSLLAEGRCSARVSKVAEALEDLGASLEASAMAHLGDAQLN